MQIEGHISVFAELQREGVHVSNITCEKAKRPKIHTLSYAWSNPSRLQKIHLDMSGLSMGLHFGHPKKPKSPLSLLVARA